jgi:hypothetical protein
MCNALRLNNPPWKPMLLVYACSVIEVTFEICVSLSFVGKEELPTPSHIYSSYTHFFLLSIDYDSSSFG